MLLIAYNWLAVGGFDAIREHPTRTPRDDLCIRVPLRRARKPIMAFRALAHVLQGTVCTQGSSFVKLCQQQFLYQYEACWVSVD